MKYEWSTFQKHLSSCFQDFCRSTKNNQKLLKNYNGNDINKKSRSWDDKKENQKNFYGFKLKTHFGVVWSNAIKIVVNCQSIYCYNAKSLIWNVFLDLVEIKLTEFFYSCIFYLPCIIVSGIGKSFFISHLVRAKFMFTLIFNFLVYRFHGNIDYLQKYIIPNLNSFPIAGVIFVSIQ